MTTKPKPTTLPTLDPAILTTTTATTRPSVRSSCGRVVCAGVVLALAGLSGCGQTNYFDVTVTVKQDPAIGLPQLLRIDSCIVSVSGATTDSFPLGAAAGAPPACSQGVVMRNNIGTFQYGTDKDSGSFTFSVLIRDGVQTTLGTGSAAGQVKSGTRTTLTVEVPLDPNAFK
jgi:hypothetical protein